MDLHPDILRQLGRIRDLGVEMGLDDFGTGYASLTHLRRLPLSFVKIDQSFVQGLGIDQEDERIVSAVVDLAANLGLRSIAEGVETTAQRDRLHALGCDQAQGYLLGRPVPPDQVPAAIGDGPGDDVLHLNLQRLEDTAELGRALISRLPGAGLLIVDADLRILLADGDVHRDLPADVVGKRVDDVIPAEAWVRLEPRYRAALAGELQSFDFDFDALGSVTAHALRFAPIRDDAGVIGVMVLSQDITARVDGGPAAGRQRAPAALGAGGARRGRDRRRARRGPGAGQPHGLRDPRARARDGPRRPGLVTHACPPPAGAPAQDHRRSLEHRTRPRRPAHRAEGKLMTAIRPELTLFVSGASDLSARAIANATELCDVRLSGRYRLSVVDVHVDPDATSKSGVQAAPTLVRPSPLPMRRFVGDLADADAVLLRLGLADVGP